MSRLYTYLPKDNTALTEGLLSTSLASQGFEKHKGLPEKKADIDLKDGKYDDVKAVYDGLTDKEKNFVTPGRRIYKDVPKYLAGRTVAYNGDTPVGFSDIYGYNNDGSLRTSPNICLAVSGEARGKHLASTMTKDVMHKVLAMAKELRKEKGARADKIKRFVWMILKENDSSARAAIHSGFKEVPYRDGSQRKFIMSRRDAEKKAEEKRAFSPFFTAPLIDTSNLSDNVGSGVAAVSVAANKASEKFPAVRRAVTPWIYNNPTAKAMAPVADYAMAKGQEGLASLTTRAQEARDKAWSQPGLGRWLKGGFYSGLSSLGSYAQPLLGGGRQFMATYLSDGGKNYRPLPNTEKMFSRDARRELGTALRRSGGKGIVSSVAYDGLSNALTTPARFEALAPTGSMTTDGKNLTDVADMNINYQAGNAPYTETQINPWARAMFGAANTVGNTFAAVAGSSDDPDAGKIHTRIPFSSLPGLNNNQAGNQQSTSNSLKDTRTFSDWANRQPAAKINTTSTIRH